MTVISGDITMPLTISGSLGDGGYQCTFTMKDAADKIVPDQEVIFYVDDKYGISWQGSSQLFRGYVPSGNITLDKDTGLFQVTAHTAEYMLRRLFLPGTAFREGNNENTKTPSTLKLSYIINNILTRMTNAADYITWDIQDSDFDIAEYSLDEGDPWSWFEEIAGYDQYLLYFDRNNKLHYKKHPMFEVTPPPAIFDFNADTMTGIIVNELDSYQVSQAYVIGFYKYDTFTSLFPASPVESGGKLLERKGIPVKTQADTDTIARRLFIFKNSKFSAVVSDARNHFMDLGDIVTVTHVDTANDIDWSYAKRFYVNNVNLTFSLDRGNPKLEAEYELIEIPTQIYFDAA
jgi:hypothetical protein